MAEHDGPGKAMTYGHEERLGTWGRIYNFDTGSAELKPPHIRWLLANIVPYLARGGSAMVKGGASRMGGDEANMKLSRQRVQRVVAMLNYLSKSQGTIRSDDQVGWGERPATGAGVAEGDNAEIWRAVDVAAWDQPGNPVLPPVAPPTPKRMVRVISHREFIEIKTEPREAVGGPPSGEGPALMATMAKVLAKLINLQLKPDGEQEDSRQYIMVPIDHHVRIAKVRVDYDVSYMSSHDMATVKTTTVDYTWAPYIDGVSVFTDMYTTLSMVNNGAKTIVTGPQRGATMLKDETHKHNIYDRATASLNSLYIPPAP